MNKFAKTLKEKDTTVFNLASKMGRDNGLENLLRVARGDSNFGSLSTSLAFVVSRMLDCSVEDLLEDWEKDGTVYDILNLKHILKRLDKLLDKDDKKPIIVATYGSKGLLVSYTHDDETGDLITMSVNTDGTYTAYRAFYTDAPSSKDVGFYKIDSSDSVFPEKMNPKKSIDYLDENREQILDAVTEGLEAENMEKITPEDFFFDTRLLFRSIKKNIIKQK